MFCRPIKRAIFDSADHARSSIVSQDLLVHQAQLSCSRVLQTHSVLFLTLQIAVRGVHLKPNKEPLN